MKAGDPSGRTTDRQVLREDVTESNADSISRCITRIFRNHGDHMYDNRQKKLLPTLRVLRNDEWYQKQSAIDFISTTCRNFRLGKMMGEYISGY